MANGLRFRKLDLHVHTVASHDFHGDATPEDIVNEAISKGLEGIAVTDHNTGQWIDKVKKAAKGKNLVVFPGVEITCEGGQEGIHIIALFDPEQDTQHITGLLEALGIPVEKHATEEAIVGEKIGVIGVIDEIAKRGGIAIPAHVNSTKGILHDMRGQQRTRIVQYPRLLAVEATDFDKPSGKRTVDYLDGRDPTYERKLAVYQASDNRCAEQPNKHCLAGIGTRCAYFKVEQINLEGLRQCFIDPDVRVRQDFEFTQLNFPHIRSLKISSGFLDGQAVHFHTGLNSIVGAKGAGKSLLMEFMRFALNQEPKHPSIADDHAGKIRARLGEYGVTEITFADETGKEFRLSRTFRELDDSPYDESVPYDPAHVFPVVFLSQNEIIKIAEDEQQQLEFIDRFFDFRSYRTKLASYERQIEKLDRQMAEGLRAYVEVEELNAKIGNLETEIHKIDIALANPIFEKYKQLELKEQTFAGQREHLSSLIENLEETTTALSRELVPSVPQQLSRDPAIQRNRDLISRAHELLTSNLLRLVEQLEKEKVKLDREYETWSPTHRAAKQEYENYVQAMGSDYQGLAVNRERISRELSELVRQRDIANNKKSEVRGISERRNELLDALTAERRKYTEERRAKCEKFQSDSAGKLKLRILDSSNVDEFRNRLLSLKRGSYLREDDIIAICSSINPRDFVISLLRYDATKESRHLEEISSAASIDIKRMKTLADFLLGSIPYEELLSLQYKALPQDRPEIHYNIGDGHYQPLSSISVGQKCTAMLIMALSDGAMPIVIDQPEDSLDIRSVWEDMCTKLRAGKEKRQFIFTTHSSSLAVASDTDCFTILEGTASQGQVVYSGSMDHHPVNAEVMKYLEGGKPTYDMKSAKYYGEHAHR